jgi:hypothetical protein
MSSSVPRWTVTSFGRANSWENCRILLLIAYISLHFRSEIMFLFLNFRVSKCLYCVQFGVIFDIKIRLWTTSFIYPVAPVLYVRFTRKENLYYI